MRFKKVLYAFCAISTLIFLFVCWYSGYTTVGSSLLLKQLILPRFTLKYKNDTYEIKFQDFKLNYRYENTKSCKNQSVLIAIALQPGDFDLRMAIRKTWAHNINSSVAYRFFVGHVANDSVMNKCSTEAHKYNDIVIIGIYDSRVSSIDKIYSIFNWQQTYCSSAKYMLKTQDNTVTSVPRLLYWIENEFNKIYHEKNGKIIFCRTLQHLNDNMNLKIKWSNKSGVEFCEKFTYLLSTEAIKLILSLAVDEDLNTIFEELMFTGILASRAGIETMHMPKHFAQEPMKANCGCDNNGVPFLISKQNNLDNDDTLPSNYSNFINLSCPDSSSQMNVEYFVHCVGHSG